MDIFDRHKDIIGQDKLSVLKKSCVLVAGVGGLGTYVSEQLTRLGVGKLYLIDNGIVDIPDLNRQTLYIRNSVGKYKVDEAEKRLLSIREDVVIIKDKSKIDEKFVISDEVNAVALCLDNIRTRLILDEKLKELNKKKGKMIPLVHTGVDEYLIQIITVDYYKVSDLKSIFFEYEEKKRINVLPQTVSIAGGLQTLELMNVLLNRSLLIGKVLQFDLKSFNFEIFNLL